MNLRSFTAGAIVAAALLAGGAAFAATDDNPRLDPTVADDRGGRAGDTRSDDNPNGDTAATDDRVARGATGATGAPAGTVATSSTVPTSVPTSSTVPPTTPGAPTVPAAGTWHPVLDVGRVIVERAGNVLHVVAVEPVAPWRAVVERGTDREVEVSFRSGGARVDFNAELEDGEVRIRVRDGRSGATSTPTVPTSSIAPSPTAPPAAAAPTETTRTQTFAGVGGQVSVSQRGSSVTLVAATPTAGWTADVRRTGPDKVEVRFRSGRAESRIEVEVDHGTLRPRVEDR